MSQAQDELVARATDPNAELSTLHELAQNYPGLRPFIAANPRTYPALLDWLGSLGDADVNAVLASRTESGTDAAMETAHRLRGRDPQATQAFPGGLPPVDPAATAAMPAAGAAVQPQYQQTQYQQPAQPSYQQQYAQQPQPQYQQEARPQYQTAQQPAQPASEETLFGVGTPEHDEEHRSSTWLWVVGAIAVVAVVALVVWFLSSNHGGSEPASSATHGTVSTQAGPAASVPPTGASSSPTESASPTPSATPSDAIKYPAPNDADTMSSFTAPSGNITCNLGQDSVSCSIDEHSFVPTDGSCDDSADKPFTVSVGKDSGASGNCDSGYSTSGATLSYGASAKNGSFACTSSESGIECWSQVSGKGFTLSRTEASATSR